MFLPGVFLSGLLRLHVEEDEGLRLRLGGDFLSDRAHDGLGGACLGDCVHPEDHEEEAEGMEDLEVRDIALVVSVPIQRIMRTRLKDWRTKR